jgi:hypothetical protein
MFSIERIKENLMGLPNRKQRRQLAKELGLFKDRTKKVKDKTKERSRDVGRVINLRNLTEQRNNKNHN